MAKGRPRRKPRLSYAARERLACDPLFIAANGAVAANNLRRDMARRRKRLARAVCSSRWFDDAWHGTTPYPPPGMTPCKRCHRATPPQCVSARGFCDDCRLAAMSRMQLDMLPSSHSVVDMREV